ncbi:UDP-glucose 4-epimerase GalE [Kordiimonas sp. SCSIO 12610]|uniref:UDP-glucose 4-epimerase GalE n=1 Tax=Kordiimonas sp. SCSIO 12610 TaxID=2829597 RepID=UPI00210BD65B|nr:UDP-glucose 4-epimerase GalE [Kordiimonas sp. SCSIO 12610]UTW54159.1 UDP-glucose 4-epimerase GalE [Kordiimonas sp. SCSIO 12610]
MPAILVTGGAGYIGGQTVLALLDSGYSVIVLDDLSTGQRASFHSNTRFYEGKVQDRSLLKTIFLENEINAVMHFAASIEVDASIKEPFEYYDNNLIATNTLLDVAVAVGIRGFIFSSTAAVYGNIEHAAREDMRCSPINPYGQSKLFAENIIRNSCDSAQMPCGILRYFNVAGADADMRHGSMNVNAKHLIARCFHALENETPLVVFGDDFGTKDGSGVRDYISVNDLADAHVATLKNILDTGASHTLNLGYGQGYSVFDIIHAVENVTGNKLMVSVGKRRKGDPASVTADTAKLKETLNWSPKYNNLEDIIETAYRWYRSVSVKTK